MVRDCWRCRRRARRRPAGTRRLRSAGRSTPRTRWTRCCRSATCGPCRRWPRSPHSFWRPRPLSMTRSPSIVSPLRSRPDTTGCRRWRRTTVRAAAHTTAPPRPAPAPLGLLGRHRRRPSSPRSPSAPRRGGSPRFLTSLITRLPYDSLRTSICAAVVGDSAAGVAHPQHGVRRRCGVLAVRARER